MTNNLPKFIALEKLAQSLQHGSVHLELQLKAGQIVGVTTTGNKRTLYNSSEKDINTNQLALEYIVKRVSQQLETNTFGEIIFKVFTVKEKIKSVEVESKQTIK